MGKRLAVLIAGLTFCLVRSAPGVTGVWVLEIQKSRLLSDDGLTKLVMEIEPPGTGEICVTRITRDAVGEHLERLHYIIALRFSIPYKALEYATLRNEETGTIEEWALRDGMLTVEVPFAVANSIPHEQLVFHKAEERPILPARLGRKER